MWCSTAPPVRGETGTIGLPLHVRPWSDRTVVVTGGRGFLGPALCARLRAAGGRAPRRPPASTDYDLRRPDDVARLFDDAQPDLVIHLAARVGGIGANMARRPTSTSTTC